MGAPVQPLTPAWGQIPSFRFVIVHQGGQADIARQKSWLAVHSHVKMVELVMM